NADAIDKAEDRALFRKAMAKIGLETPRSMLANATELKEEDRRLYEKAYNKLKNELSGDALDQALEKLEQDWGNTEASRKQHYIAHATAKA
ncbi:MAG: hypothetical protein PV353_07590, partial [Bartonella sp.]|nr:hypothetical protein [Bartonella sp.]